MVAARQLALAAEAEQHGAHPALLCLRNPSQTAQAVLGAICMVAGGASSASHAKGVTSQQASNMLVGDVCLLINTLAMAVYYIVSKQMVQRYPAICVAAWAYVVGALGGYWAGYQAMRATLFGSCGLPSPAACVSLIETPQTPPRSLNLLTAATCMSLAAAAFTTPADWHFPRAMVAPLIYWIIVCSVAGYYAVTWAMRHLPASQVRARAAEQLCFGWAWFRLLFAGWLAIEHLTECSHSTWPCAMHLFSGVESPPAVPRCLGSAGCAPQCSMPPSTLLRRVH